jgi:hypothetical protein
MIEKMLLKDGIKLTKNVRKIASALLCEYVVDTAKYVESLMPTTDEIKEIYEKIKSKTLGE